MSRSPAVPVYTTSLNPLCTRYHTFVSSPVLIWQTLIYPLRASSHVTSVTWILLFLRFPTELCKIVSVFPSDGSAGTYPRT